MTQAQTSFVPPQADMTSATRVFVGGISWKADEASLRSFFSSFGHVVDCKIIMDRETNRSKGYGFVTFSDAETAQRVKQATNLNFLGKVMNVADAYRRSDNPNSLAAAAAAAAAGGNRAGGNSSAKQGAGAFQGPYPTSPNAAAAAAAAAAAYSPYGYAALAAGAGGAPQFQYPPAAPYYPANQYMAMPFSYQYPATFDPATLNQYYAAAAAAGQPQMAGSPVPQAQQQQPGNAAVAASPEAQQTAFALQQQMVVQAHAAQLQAAAQAQAQASAAAVPTSAPATSAATDASTTVPASSASLTVANDA